MNDTVDLPFGHQIEEVDSDLLETLVDAQERDRLARICYMPEPEATVDLIS